MAKSPDNTGILKRLMSVLILGGSCAAFTPLHAVDDPEGLFKEGMDALEDDRLRTAIEAFNSILANEPGLHRARLELAVAYYRALQYEEAKKLAQQVLDDPSTPPEVRVTILAFLAQVKKDQESFAVRHEVKPSVAVGFMYDSNVNVGPSSDIVEIDGSRLTLAPGSTELSDNALVAAAGFTHRYLPGKTFQVGERTAFFLWQTEGSVYHRDYTSEDDFNLSVASFSTGPSWVVLRHWRANLPLRLEYVELGGDKLAVLTSLAPALTWQFRDGELTWDATVTHRNYADDQPTYLGGDTGREGLYIATGPSLGRYFQQRRVAAQIGARFVNFAADEDRFGYEGYEAYAGVNVKAWENGSIYGRGSYRDVEYDDIEPLFGVARDESERRLVLGVRHEFKDGMLDKWSLGGSMQYSDVSSNVSIYEYDRRQYMVNLGKTF